MSVLADLLLAKQPLFDHSLDQLEKRTGKRGVDVRLAAKIAETAAAKTMELGLQPDCSGPELYQALVKRVALDDAVLTKLIGAKDPTSLAEMAPLIMKQVKTVDMPRRGFFMKIEVAEDMLRHMPPPGIMGRLGYKDVEKLIANEDIFEIFTALRFAEDGHWLNQFNSQYASLQGGDFQERNITIVLFDYAKWGDIAAKFIKKKLHNITHSKEMGAICVMPTQGTHLKGIAITVTPLIFHYFNEVRLYSTFFKMIAQRPAFGETLADTLIADTPKVSIYHGEKIHWRVIQRYFGKLKDESHPEIFEPHVQPEDLHWRAAEDMLFQLSPELSFWNDLDFVATPKPEGMVTFNLMDVALSYANALPFEDRYLYHFRESLWNEVFASYLGQKNLKEQVLQQLDNDLIAPENIKL